MKADLCSRSQLGDWDANHPIHVLDAKASKRMGHHTEAIVGVAALLTTALTIGLTTAASGACICICIMSAMFMLNHTVPYQSQTKACLTMGTTQTDTR